MLSTFAVIVLFILCGPALAADVGDDAGVDKETMFSLIQKGGKIMYPLALGSILALALGLERFISLRKQHVLPDGFVQGLQQAWDSDPSGETAVKYCDEAGGASGHIFKAGILRANMGPEAVERAIEDVGSREADRMKRSLRPLSVIASISPLLGLLGTVYGMIDAFQATANSTGTAKTTMLATGIYEALVTTAAGLTIAIPVLLLYQFLQGRVDNMIDEIDEAVSDFVLTFMQAHISRPAIPAATPAAQPTAPVKSVATGRSAQQPATPPGAATPPTPSKQASSTPPAPVPPAAPTPPEPPAQATAKSAGKRRKKKGQTPPEPPPAPPRASTKAGS